MSTVILYFFKYQGAGNDFILFDDRSGTFPESPELISRLCDRRFGIGSDGVLLLKHSKMADFHLDFINPDGSKSFCGNGSRCGLRFAERLGLVEESCSFEAIDGRHEGLIGSTSVKISMSDVSHIDTHDLGFLLDTGSPHLVVFSEQLSEIDVKTRGAQIRYSEDFEEEGVNVNFVDYAGDRVVRIRTYERGVEDETLSCGTGVTAAVLAVAHRYSLEDGNMDIKSMGGDLKVDFKREENGFNSIWLDGPAELVFSGEFLI